MRMVSVRYGFDIRVVGEHKWERYGTCMETCV
jgi:hypothetical protein